MFQKRGILFIIRVNCLSCNEWSIFYRWKILFWELTIIKLVFLPFTIDVYNLKYLAELVTQDATLAINSAVCLGERNARVNCIGGLKLAQRKKIVKHFVPQFPITFYGFQRIVVLSSWYISYVYPPLRHR